MGKYVIKKTNTGFKFVKWTGATDATTASASVVKKSGPEAAIAIFEVDE